MTEDIANFRDLKNKCFKVISPIMPASNSTAFGNSFSSIRSRSGRGLSVYYLIYFLLVDLLNFKSDGPFDKVAWSIAIDYKGNGFFIEHRKMGLGVFIQDESYESDAAEIVELLNKGVKAAEKYFDWIAEQAVNSSKLNVVNLSKKLYERYLFFREMYDSSSEKNGNEEKNVREYLRQKKLSQEKNWIALSVLDAFFSWTEHIFIHLSILNGSHMTGNEVAKLCEASWSEKYKKALNINNPILKKYYDELCLIKNQLRNFMAHGAFGKNGEAFSFHSKVGAVPVFLPHKKSSVKYQIFGSVDFDDDIALEVVDKFIEILWIDEREIAHLYIQNSSFPLILSFVSEGKYEEAMTSRENMEELIKELQMIEDRSADMDW